MEYNKYLLTEDKYTKIIDRLWLGNVIGSQDENFIKTNNIKFIINTTPDLPNLFNNMFYLNINIKGKYINPNNKYFNIFTCFNEISDLIHKLISNNINIFIHCKFGHTRSAAFVCAYLIKYKKMSANQAITLIRTKRANTLYRDYVINSLVQFENKIYFSLI